MKHLRIIAFVGLLPALAQAHPGQGAHSHFDLGAALAAGALAVATICTIAATAKRIRSRASTAGGRRSRT